MSVYVYFCEQSSKMFGRSFNTDVTDPNTAAPRSTSTKETAGTACNAVAP